MKKNYSPELQSKITKAAELGAAAFAAGKPAAPALNQECLDLIKGNEIGQSIPILDAYLKAWHKANAAAAVPAIPEISQRKAEAMEIMNQLGGRQFIAMTGARYISYEESASFANLSFNFRGSRTATHIKIVLNVMDTYDVTFYKCRGADIKTVSEHHDIYNDMLRALFTEVTGLETSLGTLGR